MSNIENTAVLNKKKLKDGMIKSRKTRIGDLTIAFVCFILMLIECRAILFCIDTHAAELIDVKRTSAQSDAFLLIDGGPSTQFDGEPADQDEGGENNQTQG